MVSELEAEMNQDKYNMAQVSDINLDNGSVSGDMGLTDHAVTCLYSDFIFAELIDVKDGFATTRSGLRVIQDTKVKSWRKARVLLISPLVAQYGITKVGDVVLFPNDKGLATGRTSYVHPETGEVIEVKNGIFLNEQRCFTKLVEVEDEE